MARLKPSRVAFAAALACAALPAAADPVTLVATLAPVIGGTAAAFIVTNAAYIAFGAYMLYSNNAARRKARAADAAARSQYNASLQDRNVNVLSGEAPWQVVYGNPAPVGGAIVGIFSSGARDQFKHLVVVYASHPCQAMDEIYIDGEPVGALDGNGDCISGAFYESTTTSITEQVALSSGGVGTLSHTVVTPLQATWNGVGIDSAIVSGTTVTTTDPETFGQVILVSYTWTSSMPRVNVQKHLSPGGVDTADAYLMARCPEWTAADKLSGYTYAVISLDLDLARFQGGPPNVAVKLRGKPVYDWRTGLTAYSANPVLCLADFLTSEAGFGASAAQIDSATTIASANAADASGFLCDGVFTTDAARESVKQDLEDCFGGFSHQSGGVWRILPGAWTSPVMTISEADLAAPIQITQASYSSKERYNTVRGSYVAGDGLGVATDFTPWSNPAYVAADGTTRVRDVSFPFTKDHQRTQDLARMIVERSRGGLSITIPGHLRLWPLQPGDRVALVNGEYAWTGKTFRINDWDAHPNAPMTVSAVEDVAVYYDAAAVITVDAAPNTNLPDPFAVPALVGLTASSGTDQLLVQADGTITTRVMLAWEAATDTFVVGGGVAQLQCRAAAATDGIWQSLPAVPGDSSKAYVLGLQDGLTYLIRARFVNSLNIPGAWSTIVHQVVGKTEPPDDVTSFTLDGDVLRWIAVDDIDLAGYRIRVNYGLNTFWGSGAPLHEGLVTASPYTMAARPSGPVTILIKAVDTSGNESENPGLVITDLGDIEISNILFSYAEAPTFSGAITNGAISAGVLQASATDFLYGDDAQAFYGPDTDAFYATATYAQMQYEWGETPSAEGKVVVLHTISGSDYTLEYRRGSQDAFYGVGLDLFYGADAEPFYGVMGAWGTWPGSVVLSGPEEISWRITTAGGPVQGQISVATVVLDVPDIEEELEDIVISAAGTRLPITETYRAIKSVLLTVQTDGNGGRDVQVEDKSATSGPLITVRNAAGTAVIGLVDARIKGY